MKKPTPLQVKKSGIRAIDRGTRYDVSGKLRAMARAIEAGKYGDVKHAVLGVTYAQNNDIYTVTQAWGSDDMPAIGYTVDRMKKWTMG